MSLRDWLKNGWLTGHETTRQEIAQLEAFRKKRNISDYERVGGVSTQEAHEMIDLAKRLRDDLVRWLQRAHPDVLSQKR